MALHRSFAGTAALLLVSIAAVAEARPCSGVSAGRAFAEAVLIVKSVLLSTTPASQPEGDSTSLVRVDRVLKGSTTRREIEVVHFLCGVEYEQAFKPGRPILVFIDGAGRLVGGTAVLAASDQDGSPAAEARSALRGELLADLDARDPLTNRAGVGALAELDGPSAAPAIAGAARSEDFGTRIRALSWLTRFGDEDAFDRFAAIVTKPPFTPSSIPTTIRDGDDHAAALWIAYNDALRALESFWDRDFKTSTLPAGAGARFVATMVNVARFGEPYIHREAVMALRGFKNRASFPYLLETLEDSDSSVRYNAMFTLCMAMKAPDLPCPAVQLFHTNESLYLDRVRAWWRAER